MEIDEQIVYNQLSTKKNAIWSLLLASGYLRVLGTTFVERTGRRYYKLVLTNKEVCIMFEDIVRDWFSENDYYNDFIKALLLGDMDAMNTYMNRVTREIFSYFDTDKNPYSEPERFYHSFILDKVQGTKEKELSDTVSAALRRHKSNFGGCCMRSVAAIFDILTPLC